MNQNAFFAFVHRTKFIQRWGLMRNIRQENLKEHSYDVAVIAHGIALIGNTYYARNYDAGKICSAALYHDVNEAITGDMPTPVKYSNPVISRAYREIEAEAMQKILRMLPEELQSSYRACMELSSMERKVIKAADKISAYVKCIEERKAGNDDFATAEKGLQEQISNMDLPEVQQFTRQFLPAYGMTLDEMEK